MMAYNRQNSKSHIISKLISIDHREYEQRAIRQIYLVIYWIQLLNERIHLIFSLLKSNFGQNKTFEDVFDNLWTKQFIG